MKISRKCRDFLTTELWLRNPTQRPLLEQTKSFTIEFTFRLCQGAEGLAQSADLPLVPYLDTLRWVFIALALGGIAVVVWAGLDDWKRGRR